MRSTANRDEILARTRPLLEVQPEILFAYLFGSFAEGCEHPDSDVDIALYLQQDLDRRRTLNLGGALEACLGRRIDLVVLNYVPISLAFHAIRGIVIMERHAGKRALAVSRIMSRYYDYQHFFRFYRGVIADRARAGREQFAEADRVK